MLSFNWAGWFLEMVAFGNRKDFLQFLRVGHFHWKCPTRKNCKRNAAERYLLMLKFALMSGCRRAPTAETLVA